jgi:7-keto-8-aminopelargonate synthetase-like enzyme
VKAYLPSFCSFLIHFKIKKKKRKNMFIFSDQTSAPPVAAVAQAIRVVFRDQSPQERIQCSGSCFLHFTYQAGGAFSPTADFQSITKGQFDDNVGNGGIYVATVVPLEKGHIRIGHIRVDVTEGSRNYRLKPFSAVSRLLAVVVVLNVAWTCLQILQNNL